MGETMRKNNKDLKLPPNAGAVKLTYQFDTPKSFPDGYKEGATRYAFTFKVVEDQTGNYEIGEEVTYFTSYEPLARQLLAGNRGDSVVMYSVQNATDKWPTTYVKAPDGSDIAPAQLPGEAPTPDSPLEDVPDIFSKEGDEGKPEAPSHTSFLERAGELMADCMEEASAIREDLINRGVPPEQMGEYWLTKTGLTLWMQVK